MNELETLNDNSPAFWPHFLRDESLQACSNLERLVAGCELIATLDDLEMLGLAA